MGSNRNYLQHWLCKINIFSERKNLFNSEILFWIFHCRIKRFSLKVCFARIARFFCDCCLQLAKITVVECIPMHDKSYTYIFICNCHPGVWERVPLINLIGFKSYMTANQRRLILSQ
jgi:hypothetical protein